MSLEKITTQQMDAKGVCAAPDILSGTAAQNKAVFDRMVRELIAPAYNAAVDAINAINQTESGIEAAEALRVAAEDLRASAETARAQAENGRVTAEQARVEAENLRAAAEALRTSAEQARVAAEQKRVTAEQSRDTAEQNRASAEQGRVSAEADRVAAENARADENTGIVAQATAQAQAAAASAARAEQIAIGGIPDGTIPEEKLEQSVQDAIDRAKDGGEIDTLLLNKAAFREELTANGKFVSDFNEAKLSGWYCGNSGAANAPELIAYASYSSLLVLARNTAIIQVDFVYQPSANGLPVQIAIRGSKDGGSTWQPWEYVNPPMAIGVEYRTTERWNGKPVYVKRINFGALPANTTKKVEHGISDFQSCVGIGGSVNNHPLSYFMPDLAITADATYVIIISPRDYSAWPSSTVTVKYTKTTD